jgi:hypothetical protein
MKKLLLFLAASAAYGQNVGSGIAQPALASASVANDTNVTGAISGNTLTLGWTGALAAARLNSNVVQSVANDTNVTGTISGQTLTLGWQNTLSKARQYANTAYTDQSNNFSGYKQIFGATATTAGEAFAGVTADPSSLTAGDRWFRTDLKRLRYYDGSATQSLAQQSDLTNAAYTNQANAFGPFTQTFGGSVGISTASPTTALTVNGTIGTTALATPGAPTVTPVGTAGSTIYNYAIVAKQIDGSYTVSGPPGPTTTGNATLDGTNYNAVTWSAVPGAASYDVYRTSGGPIGRIGTNITATTYNDQGGAASGTRPTTGGNTGGASFAAPYLQLGLTGAVFTGINSGLQTAVSQTPVNVINNFNSLTGLYLKKTGTGTGDYLAVDNVNAAAQFYVKSSGSVGIGTAAPTTALTVNGSMNVIALATPGAPTVTPTGAAGSTTYSYVVVAKQNDGSYSAAGSAGSTSTGNATLTSSNYNAITWSAVTYATSYDVYCTAGCATLGKVASGITTTAYNDQSGAGDSSTAPTINTTGSLRLGSGNAPAASSNACTAGAIAWDTGYIYLCTASAAWKRAALSTF